MRRLKMTPMQELKLELIQRKDELKRKDEIIFELEREIDEKDALIRHLKNEIDKFQQVVRPLTREICRKKCTVEDDEKAPKFTENRPKRQAISAEPILNGAGDFPIVKIPKSAE